MKQTKIKLMIILYFTASGITFSQAKTQELPDSAKTEVRIFGSTIPKENSTASVSSVSGSTIRSINTPNTGNLLPGQLTGLNVSQTGSAPGYQDWPWLLIRGKASFLGNDGNDIKVVVDGFETKWNNIIADEIESVSVLKDAAAVALYGIDAANGVLYIQTKRGVKRDKNRITFNSRFSFQQPTVLPRYVNNGTYASLYNEALKSDGKDISTGPFGNEYVVQYYGDGSYPYIFAGVDWIREVTKNQAFAHDYSLSVNGGNEVVTYNVLLGFMNTQGIYSGTDPQRNTDSNWDLRRYTVRTNLDIRINKFLRSEIALRTTIDDKQRPNTDEATLWKNLGVFIPYPVQTESGGWAGSQNYAENPAASIRAKGYRLDNDRTIDANVKLVGDLSLLAKGLEAFGQVVFSNNYVASYNKTRGFAYTEYVPALDPFGFIDYTTIARGNADSNFSIEQPSGAQWNRYNVLAGLNYNQVIGNVHRIQASSQYLQELYRDQGSNMPWAKMGVAGRFNYSYADKYIVELDYSVMGTAEYAPGHRFGFFPALSGAWILSKENFLKDNKAIPYLKLSSSYGIVGNNNLGGGSRFTYKQYYMGSGVPYYLGSGFTTTVWPKKQGSLGNPDVTWEKSHKFNVALAGNFFRQVDFNVEYFRDYRTDIFVSPSSYLSALVGAEYYNQNAGIAGNRGFEAEVSYHNRVGRVGYSLGGRFSYAKNNIIDMKEAPKAEDYLYLTGRPIDQPLVLEAIGFFKDEQDIRNSPLQMFGTVQPGDVKYKDQNGDGVLDDNDRKSFGYPTYPRFYYGADLGLDYLGFDLTLFVQGTGGRTVSLLNSGFMTPFVSGGVKPHPELAEHYWTPERGDAARFPRLTTESNNNNYRASTLWQIDGSYIRVKNIELGYTFPVKWLPGISGLRLYVNMVNPFTFSKLSEYNLDPEINSPYKYPLMKSTNFGFSLQF
ncbi:SusC/RagA family TonB-linked outer membrane protein [Bacteroidia bacterium]|nr:SusC/RagA family TonB-linked outer membrane protein [Bacteroidia bacterium]